MLRHFPKLLASFLLIAGLTAPAQIIRLGTPKKSSAGVGVNTVEAPVPTPLINGKKAFISYELGNGEGSGDRTGAVDHLRDLLLEFARGFSFVGSQVMCPVTSQSKSIRIAARCCLTVGLECV
ncbi:hypothetical protein [Tunturiibacter lichenicola]|jgi:hypothetical protein|uniref:hypothetical protein n=1 Tax=Tunturiibacter lichenicola TaxID=2051959 RepID=UPI003D9B6C57